MSKNQFIEGYIEAALWSSTYGENGEGNLDDGEHELADDTRTLMHADAGSWYDANAETLASAVHSNVRSDDDAQAGQDFWLTRNGHGAGFWDGDWDDTCGPLLDKAAKAAGPRDLYVGDDGLIYQG